MEYTFDAVADLLDTMAESFPPALFQGLNGGILLQEEEKQDPQFPEGEMLFMGEYIVDAYLGRYIHLYYGSFLASARNEHWTQADWQEELYTTLAHELTHHVESLANDHALDDKDEAELRQYLAEYRTRALQSPAAQET